MSELLTQKNIISFHKQHKIETQNQKNLCKAFVALSSANSLIYGICFACLVYQVLKLRNKLIYLRQTRPIPQKLRILPGTTWLMLITPLLIFFTQLVVATTLLIDAKTDSGKDIDCSNPGIVYANLDYGLRVALILVTNLFLLKNLFLYLSHKVQKNQQIIQDPSISQESTEIQTSMQQSGISNKILGLVVRYNKTVFIMYFSSVLLLELGQSFIASTEFYKASESGNQQKDLYKSWRFYIFLFLVFLEFILTLMMGITLFACANLINQSKSQQYQNRAQQIEQQVQLQQENQNVEDSTISANGYFSFKDHIGEQNGPVLKQEEEEIAPENIRKPETDMLTNSWATSDFFYNQDVTSDQIYSTPGSEYHRRNWNANQKQKYRSISVQDIAAWEAKAKQKLSQMRVLYILMGLVIIIMNFLFNFLVPAYLILCLPEYAKNHESSDPSQNMSRQCLDVNVYFSLIFDELSVTMLTIVLFFVWKIIPLNPRNYYEQQNSIEQNGKESNTEDTVDVEYRLRGEGMSCSDVQVDILSIVDPISKELEITQSKTETKTSGPSSLNRDNSNSSNPCTQYTDQNMHPLAVIDQQPTQQNWNFSPSSQKQYLLSSLEEEKFLKKQESISENQAFLLSNQTKYQYEQPEPYTPTQNLQFQGINLQSSASLKQTFGYGTAAHSQRDIAFQQSGNNSLQNSVSKNQSMQILLSPPAANNNNSSGNLNSNQMQGFKRGTISGGNAALGFDTMLKQAFAISPPKTSYNNTISRKVSTASLGNKENKIKKISSGQQSQILISHDSCYQD